MRSLLDNRFDRGNSIGDFHYVIPEVAQQHVLIGTRLGVSGGVVAPLVTWLLLVANRKRC